MDLGHPCCGQKAGVRIHQGMGCWHSARSWEHLHCQLNVPSSKRCQRTVTHQAREGTARGQTPWPPGQALPTAPYMAQCSLGCLLPAVAELWARPALLPREALLAPRDSHQPHVNARAGKGHARTTKRLEASYEQEQVGRLMSHTSLTC